MLVVLGGGRTGQYYLRVERINKGMSAKVTPAQLNY
jgi:hypothetical protein